MQKARFTEEPEVIVRLPRPDGSAEVWLRSDIHEVTDGEETYWEADEVQFVSRLSEEEIMNQADMYFIEEPEVTINDLVEAIDILADLVMEV